MTTQSCTHSIPVWEPYTGTIDQPDSVSIFYRHGNGDKIEIVDESFVNSLGHSPTNMLTALPRISAAFHRILSEPCNAIKNLVRGIIQLIPLLGNATLYAFDYVRTNFYFHSQLKAALANQDSPVIGVAFDGKIVASFSPEELARALGSEPNDHLKSLNSGGRGY